jgi:predicted TIM-barrel fold metal-dependent hydrolase
MIIDCHTHTCSDPSNLASHAGDGQGPSGYSAGKAGTADHALASQCVTQTLVLGCCGANLAQGSNESLAKYVGRNADRMIGIAGIDPTAGGAIAQASAWLDRKEFAGLAISPAGCGFHPADSRAMKLYELAQRRGAPVFFHHDINSSAGGKMEYARPVLLDEIAREFPALTLVVPALGYPWTDECIVLIGKNPRVYADIAGLMRRPWPAYSALLSAYQFGVMDKLLFGSDFPFATAAETIEAVYRLNEITQGTHLPVVPREALRQMVQRDALACLGIRQVGLDPDKK